MALYIALMLRNSRLFELGKMFEKLGYSSVPIEFQHLTLLFIGDVDSYRESVLKKYLASKVYHHPRIIEVNDVVALPQHKATNIALLVNDRGELRKLHEDLYKEIGSMVSINDRYSFLPHITIARRPRPLPEEFIEDLEMLMKHVKKVMPRRIHVLGMALVKSWKGRQNVEMWLSEPLVR